MCLPPRKKCGLSTICAEGAMPRPLEVLGSRRIDKRIELDGFVLLASEHWNHELDSQSPTSTPIFPACAWRMSSAWRPAVSRFRQDWTEFVR